MRYYFIILTLTVLSLNSTGQQQSLDSLLTKIDNQQIIIRYGTFWEPDMLSPAGDSIIKIGKTATKKLYDILNSSSRGIIAHYILIHIWVDQLKNKAIEISVYPSLNSSTPQKLVYANLVFYRNGTGYNFAKQEALIKNKKSWMAFIRNYFRCCN